MRRPEQTAFERFKEFTRRLVAVPKVAIEKEAWAYRKRRRRAVQRRKARQNRRS